MNMDKAHYNMVAEIEHETELQNELQNEKPQTENNFFDQLRANISKVKWSNVLILAILHSLAVFGLFYILLLGHPVKMYTVIFTYVLGAFSGMGITVGAHRLWAHKSFKARLPFRIFLSIAEAMTMNGSVYSFARDHRSHHKFTDTAADPKNTTRGLFYSHIGWWMLKKSEEVKNNGNKLDLSDLRDDWVVWYQHRFYSQIFVLFGLIIPTAVPHFCWNEDLLISFLVPCVFRIAIILHHYFTVNSISHFFGARPYDYGIRPTENRFVSYLTLGEGAHNYHHTFPYDYTTSGSAAWEYFNPSTLLIEAARLLGQAYDLKEATPDVIESTIIRKGIPGSQFDAHPKGSFCFRVTSGLVDWIVGLLVALYPVTIGMSFQLLTGNVIFVW